MSPRKIRLSQEIANLQFVDELVQPIEINAGAMSEIMGSDDDLMADMDGVFRKALSQGHIDHLLERHA